MKGKKTSSFRSHLQIRSGFAWTNWVPPLRDWRIPRSQRSETVHPMRGWYYNLGWWTTQSWWLWLYTREYRHWRWRQYVKVHQLRSRRTDLSILIQWARLEGWNSTKWCRFCSCHCWGLLQYRRGPLEGLQVSQQNPMSWWQATDMRRGIRRPSLCRMPSRPDMEWNYMWRVYNCEHPALDLQWLGQVLILIAELWWL